MITDVYSINSIAKFSRFNIKDKGLEFVSDMKIFSDLLIMPAVDHKNKRPYIQNFEKPNIEDFYKDKVFSFSNVFQLSNLLENVEKDDNFLKLKDYFRALRLSIFKGESYDDQDDNIILVPDSYTAMQQEYILALDSFDRQNTTLLWRSVAACLGADLLDAKDGQKVLVLDYIDGQILSTILTLKEYSRGGVVAVVPQRKAYNSSNKSDFYPKLTCDIVEDISLPKQVKSFFDATFKTTQKGAFIAPYKDAWREFKTPRPDKVVLSSSMESLLSDVDYCIVLGDINLGVDSPKIIFDKEFNLLHKGAASFAYNRKMGYPTYLDQCEGLYIVVQQNETVETDTLIEAKDDCYGGEKIDGIINEKSFIEKQNSTAHFYLKMGDSDSLKELTQEFPETTQNQRIKLVPTMVPGQGIAQVKVEAYPLLSDSIMLDFLQMQNSQKTLLSLQNEIKRSFPIEIPQVEVNLSKWNCDLIDEIENYTNGGCLPDSNIFSKTTYKNQQAEGIERFQRVNAFGNEGKIPHSYETIIEGMFKKLAKDYRSDKYEKDDIVRIVAWTYNYGNYKYFNKIKNDVLSKIEKETSIKKQYHTFCGNFLCEDMDLICHYNALSERISIAIKSSNNNKIEKISDWLRGFGEILVNNNEMLKIFENKKYSKLIKCSPKDFVFMLLAVYLSYIKYNNGIGVIRIVLKCMLFFLKYRKYNKSFIRENDPETSQLYSEILEKTDPCLIPIYKHPDVRALVCNYRDYVQGNGTLEGIPNLVD